MPSQAPTPYADLNAVLGRLLTSLKSELGDNLLALYLQGSFAVGDFDEHSDVDFIAVLNNPLQEHQITSLNRMHEAIYNGGPEWAKHLEGSYFTREELAAEPGQPVWYLDHGSVKLERSNHCNTWVVRAVLHGHGVPLLGPPAARFVPAVDTEVLRNEIATTMKEWGADILANPEPYYNRFYQGFIVLSYCRMLGDYETGAVGSKRRGAEWAKQNLSPEWHDLIDKAWQTRPNPATSSRTPPDDADIQKTLAFVQLCIDYNSPSVTES